MAIRQVLPSFLRSAGVDQETTALTPGTDQIQQTDIEARRKRLRDRGLRTSILSGGGAINPSAQGAFNIQSLQKSL